MPLGFQRSQLISMAQKRTEGRANALDANAEFAMALQEVCMDMRWWWRRKIKSFTVTAGKPDYELGGIGGLGIPDLQQIPRDGLKLFPGGNDVATPAPVFDMDTQQMILALRATNPPGLPSQYFLIGSQPGTLHVNPLPDKDYPASLAYWAVPIYVLGGEDGEEENIPLIPAYMHSVLLKRLEMHFLAFSLGEDSTKYKVASAEYEDMKNNADQFENFAEGEVRSFASDNYNDSVRSS